MADSFDANANSLVLSIVVQSDGKILVGGGFSIIGGGVRSRIARLDGATGASDSFNPTGNNFVYTVALLADGKILAGGEFTNIGGQPRTLFARLSNDTAALSALSVSRTAVTLTRNGSAAQFSRVVFEQSIDNGATYTLLGTAANSFASPAGTEKNTRFAPQVSGYNLTGLNLPTGQNILIRARGTYSSGFGNGSTITEDKVQIAYFLAPTAANAGITGRVMTANGRPIRNATLAISGGNLSERKYARTNSFGYYRFQDLEVGQTYVIDVASKRYSFANPNRLITLNESLNGEDFVSDGK